MIYTNRFQQILKIALEQDEEYISIDALSKRLKTSRRTIFRELQNANLRPYDLQLVSKQGKGIRLEGEKNNKQRLLAALETESIPYLNKEERRKLLAFELLRFPEVKKLVYYGNMFSVSETTISNDLDALEPWLSSYGIRLDRKNKNKIRIFGKEEDRRKAMSEIIHDTIGAKEAAIDYLDPKALQKEIFESSQEGILQLLNQELLGSILDLFTLERKELGLDQYVQSSYIGLIIHLVVAIERIKKGQPIESDPSLYEEMAHTSNMIQAQKIAKRIEQIFDIQMPQAEIVFIAMHLRGAKSINPTEGSEDKKIMEVVYCFIEDFPNAIASCLSTDPQFIEGFVTHLRPTLIRLNRSLPIYNPLLDTIKTQYKELYELTLHAAKHIEKIAKVSISEAEIAFMTMHVGASLERRRSEARQTKLHTGVVCASGIGVSALLSARLQYVFGNRLILETLSLEQYKDRFEQFDLIISTFDMAEKETKIIKVNPLLSQQDIDRIREVIEEIHQSAHFDQEDGAMEKLKRIEKMSESARHIIDDLVFVTVPSQMDLSQLIEEASVLAKGSPSQIVKDLHRREELGSILIPELGFGLLHTKTTGIEKPQVQFLWPDQQYFTQYENIEVVFVLLLPYEVNSYDQKLLSLISTHMMEDDRLREAVFAHEERHIQQVLSSIYLQSIHAEMA